MDVHYWAVHAASGFISIIISGAVLFSGPPPATPYHISILSGQGWVLEPINGHPECMRTELGVQVHVFQRMLFSAWKFSWKTAKKTKPGLDPDLSGLEIPELGKTVTTVWSLVYLDFQIFKDWERLAYLRSISLSTFKIQAFLVHNIILHTTRYKINLSLWWLSNEECDTSIKWMHNQTLHGSCVLWGENLTAHSTICW